jgi:hypothetical protein
LCGLKERNYRIGTLLAAKDKNCCGCNGIADIPILFILEQQINNLGHLKIINCTLRLSVTRNDESSLLESSNLGFHAETPEI